MNEWIYETHDTMKYGFKAKEILYHKQSLIQDILVIDTEKYGKILFLDNCVMLSEKWEFLYHEMITHPVLFTHPQPENVLIIGGGDGGTLRETVRHAHVKHVDMVEIDGDVIDVCKKFFPQVSSELNSPKANVVVGDGIEYVKDKKGIYDVVIIDSSDPVGPAEGLFNQEFYNNAWQAMKDDGMLVTQSESPFYVKEFFTEAVVQIKDRFPITATLLFPMPDYPFGLWTITIGSKKYHPVKDYNKEAFKKAGFNTRYYNEVIHGFSFNMPRFFMEENR